MYRGTRAVTVLVDNTIAWEGVIRRGTGSERGDHATRINLLPATTTAAAAVQDSPRTTETEPSVTEYISQHDSPRTRDQQQITPRSLDDVVAPPPHRSPSPNLPPGPKTGQTGQMESTRPDWMTGMSLYPTLSEKVCIFVNII